MNSVQIAKNLLAGLTCDTCKGSIYVMECKYVTGKCKLNTCEKWKLPDWWAKTGNILDDVINAVKKIRRF